MNACTGGPDLEGNLLYDGGVGGSSSKPTHLRSKSGSFYGLKQKLKDLRCKTGSKLVLEVHSCLADVLKMMKNALSSVPDPQKFPTA